MNSHGTEDERNDGGTAKGRDEGGRRKERGETQRRKNRRQTLLKTSGAVAAQGRAASRECAQGFSRPPYAASRPRNDLRSTEYGGGVGCAGWGGEQRQ